MIDFSDKKRVTLECLFGHPQMIALWGHIDFVIEKAPPALGKQISEALDEMYNSGRNQTVIATIKHHAGNAAMYDTERHMCGEKPIIKKVMKAHRQEVQTFFNEVLIPVMDRQFIKGPTDGATK